MLVLFHTLGCKVNQYETQVMRKTLENLGYVTFDATMELEFFSAVVKERDENIEDLVIVLNSCTVTGESDRKIRQILRRYRREYPGAVIVLSGCMPQAFPDIAEKFDTADIVLGTATRNNLPHFIKRFITYRQRIIEIKDHGKEFEKMSISGFEGRTRAFIKIQDGCNHFCTYCIIPYARGRIRSKSLSDLKKEVETLAKEGYREVVLVGINLTSYGKGEGFDLADAVEVAASVEEIQRVRLGSLDPDMITKEIVEKFRKHRNKLCPQFHLSLQSGSDSVLERMNRHYNKEEYLDVCKMLRENFDNPAITTDIMVGFPRETKEEHDESMDFAKEVGFADAHIFAYSIRKGTPAAKMLNQVDGKMKKERSREMISLCNGLKQEYISGFIQKEVKILCEQEVRGFMEGHTPEYFIVRFKGDKNLEGKTVKVRITNCKDGICYGNLI